jgi:DNA gyrase subunit A
VIAARRTNGQQEVLIASASGKSVRFVESQVRAMGRTATGVRGISLADGDRVVGMEILSPAATILTVTERGFGKRTPLEDYRLQKRGGQGVITIRTTGRNGPVIGVAQVLEDDEVMLITDGGKVLRCRVSGISTMGRVTQGVTLMDLDAAERLVAVARLAEHDDASNGRGEGGV